MILMLIYHKYSLMALLAIYTKKGEAYNLIKVQIIYNIVVRNGAIFYQEKVV